MGIFQKIGLKTTNSPVKNEMNIIEQKDNESEEKMTKKSPQKGTEELTNESKIDLMLKNIFSIVDDRKIDLEANSDLDLSCILCDLLR
jgi:hypothetical protein